MNDGRIRISSMALRAIEDALTNIFLPPDALATPLRQALARHYRVDEKCVVVGNGSTEVMNALAVAVTDCRAGEFLVSSPTFSLYSILAAMHGFNVRTVALKNYAHDIESLKGAANNSTRVIFLDSPHYVTGMTVTAEAILDLASARPETIVVFDNVYGEFQTNKLSDFICQVVQNNPNVLVCRSFSKVHALLGLRVGYGIGHPALIEKINSKIVPYSVNLLAQAAAVASLRDTENVRRNVEFNEQAKRMSYELLDELGVAYIPTQSNALLINLGNNVGRIAELCRQRGVKCRDEKKCGLAGHIQVHLIDPETITPFLEVLRGAYDKEKGGEDDR